MLTMVATIGSTQDIDEATTAGIFRMAKVIYQIRKGADKKAHSCHIKQCARRGSNRCQRFCRVCNKQRGNKRDDKAVCCCAYGIVAAVHFDFNAQIVDAVENSGKKPYKYSKSAESQISDNTRDKTAAEQGTRNAGHLERR